MIVENIEFWIYNRAHILHARVAFWYFYSDWNEKLSKHFLCFVFSYPSVAFVIFHCSHQPAIIIVFHYLPLNVWKWSISSPAIWVKWQNSILIAESNWSPSHIKCKLKSTYLEYREMILILISFIIHISEINFHIIHFISIKDSINRIWFYLNIHLLVHIVLTHHAQQ